MWKPQFLSVVQFPFDNCHSPFSPTTFFEIGVCQLAYEENLSTIAVRAGLDTSVIEHGGVVVNATCVSEVKMLSSCSEDALLQG